ncbi:MAG TPA: serine hydrolase domain-containing protein, partial [Thermoanaerobaculia bacterium]|nr:serine hydrolase domain-containing protein [Thermoanaerobaculia bacterium]
MQSLARLFSIALVVLCAASAAAQEVLTSDTPRTTVAGNAFIAPAGWKISVHDQATILESPEGNSRIALVDVKAADADSAVKAAWTQYGIDPKWPLVDTNDLADKDGWTNVRVYNYQTAPNEKRVVQAAARKANDVWTVAIVDFDQAVAEKRGAQAALIFGRLLPKGYSRESFAGKTAHKLDAKRIAELTKFVESGRTKLGIAGVSIGVIEDGKVLYTGGFGQKDIDSPARPDADTLYMIASNSKALTTLMLAKLVDEGKFTWDTHVTSVLPSFKLGDADTTRQVLIKHLICACTGLPRQDFEWLFQFEGSTPKTIMDSLATMQPTSKFGELFQYSNPLAAAAGYVGGHAAYPDLDLGRAYDEAMRTRVFTPLHMSHTTFDFKKALAANHASAHGVDVDGKPAHAVFDVDYSAIPIRPAGGAWSNVNDLVRYVQMELNEGTLPDGKRYISKEALLARRAPQVEIGKDVTYGMGLMVDRKYGIPIVHHG